MNSLEMEVALAAYFNSRTNLIVPNVSWGFGFHECDLLVVTPSGYVSEIEIKTNKADLVCDKDKTHGHKSEKIKFLYFAIPEELLKWQEYIPGRAGILAMRFFNKEEMELIEIRKKIIKNYKPHPPFIRVKKIRDPEIYSEYKITDKERYQIARLGTMRIWTLKKTILKCRESRSI